MLYTKQILEVPSTDGSHTLRGVVYTPEIENPRGILQVVHGMAEHIGRYHDFMAHVASEGFVVCGHDHIGHGKTAEDPSELGYFAEQDGWHTVTADIRAFGNAVKAGYRHIPHTLLGHSMGSFLSRAAVVKFPADFDALIIMGTGGPNPLSTIGLFLTSVIGNVKGQKHISKLVNNMAFGAYNKKTQNESPFAWLTHDTEMLKKHDGDPLCLFPFTVSAMHDLIAVQKAVNQTSWFDSVRKDLPILIVSGDEDPVGDYGKGVRAVYDGLFQANCQNVSMILYPQMRHEILNEIEREKVYADIKNFLISLGNI